MVVVLALAALVSWSSAYLESRAMNDRCHRYGFDSAFEQEKVWYCTIRTPPHTAPEFGNQNIITQETLPVDVAPDFEVEAYDARIERGDQQ